MEQISTCWMLGVITSTTIEVENGKRVRSAGARCSLVDALVWGLATHLNGLLPCADGLAWSVCWSRARRSGNWAIATLEENPGANSTWESWKLAVEGLPPESWCLACLHEKLRDQDGNVFMLSLFCLRWLHMTEDPEWQHKLGSPCRLRCDMEAA